MTHDYVESKLFELIEEKNPAAVIFYCKTKLRHRGYVEKLEADLTVTAGRPKRANLIEVYERAALAFKDKSVIEGTATDVT